ncbi:GSCOCG00010043001-RA-CDS [Cotesia congregata]|nr:GSCOCG00010043001-RA-CDS [Cotesia congregata]
MKSLDIAKGSTLVLCLLIGSLLCNADKLSPGQKAPPHATKSGGESLQAPPPGSRAADVGSRPDVGRSGGSRLPATPPQAPKEDGVIREETEDLKEVNGQLVRVVKGNFGYDSPEGLPIAVKYEADENGNRASFTIGKPGGGGGGGGVVVADLAEMLELAMVAKVVQALVAANLQQAAEDHPVPTKLIFLQVNLFNNDKYFQQLFTLEVSNVGLMQFLLVQLMLC